MTTRSFFRLTPPTMVQHPVEPLHTQTARLSAYLLQGWLLSHSPMRSQLAPFCKTLFSALMVSINFPNHVNAFSA